jgi:hypothetical protein
MITPPERNIIPLEALVRGPDAIRGSGQAFIYTKYTDPQGHRWFIQPGHIGHETITNSRDMLQALFGPRATEVALDVITIGDVYGKDDRGFPKATGEKSESDHDN